MRLPNTGESQHRFLAFRRAEAKAAAKTVGDNRLLTLSFSSEQPCERWFGDEVLSHAEGAADFSRLNDSAPLLWNHDPDQIIGVVERAWIEKSRGMATVRFARTPEADGFMAMVNDGVVRNVSFAYQVDRYAEGVSPNDGEQTFIAMSWIAFEISLVSVPADQSIGVGRAHQPKRNAHMPEPNEVIHEEQRRESRAARAYERGLELGRGEGARGGREVERERIAEIQALCRRHDCGDLEDGLIRNGASIEDARADVLNRITRRNAQRPVADMGGHELGLSEREMQSYSINRAILAQITGDWSKAGLERSASDAVSRSIKRETTGFFVPSDVMLRANWASPSKRAAYAVGGAATGGVLVGTQLLAQNFIELLRNSTRVIQAGATFITGLVGNVELPRRSAATAAQWVGESTAPNESESTFEKVAMTPRTLAAYSKMSRLALLQTTPDIEMVTRNDLVTVLGLGIDLAALSGTGAGSQPMGIANTTGIGSVVGGTNGANVSIDNLIDLESAATVANAPEESFAYIMNAQTVGSLKKLKATTNQYLWTASPIGQRSGTPGTVNGYPAFRSNQARSNLTKGTASGVCSEIFFGSWSELLIGEWGVLEILANPYGTGFSKGDVEIRAMQTIDVAVKHAPSFAVMSDALTP